MKKAWLYAQGKVCTSVFEQAKALSDYCKQNGIEVAGETHMISEVKDNGYSLMDALRNAVEHKCDCIIVQEAKELCIGIDRYFKLLEAYVQDKVTIFSLDEGDMLQKIFSFRPLLHLFFVPEFLGLGDNEIPEYPEERGLDPVQVRANRSGEVRTVAFTDLLRDERVYAVNSLPEDVLKELCLQLSESLRYIGDAFGIRHNEKGEMYATSVKAVEITGIMTEQ